MKIHDRAPTATGTVHIKTSGNRAVKCCGLLTGSRAAGALSSDTIVLKISSRNSRVAALQRRWDPLRAGLDLILDQRGADMADVPGGASQSQEIGPCLRRERCRGEQDSQSEDAAATPLWRPYHSFAGVPAHAVHLPKAPEL
jgi:hypothetical protein